MKVGDTFCHPMRRNTKCHVRGFCDDLIVVRYWRRSKQRWEYEVMYPDILELAEEWKKAK